MSTTSNRARKRRTKYNVRKECIDICLGGNSNSTAKAAEAPPAPEAAPEEVVLKEDTSTKQNERKQSKNKASGLDNYRTDIGTGGAGSGLNIPV